MKRDARLDNVMVSEANESLSAEVRAAIYLRWLAGDEYNIKAYARSVCERALELDRAKEAARLNG